VKRNIKALLLIVLVAVIVAVVLGVFLPGGDDEKDAPATVASVEKKAVPAKESAPAKEKESAPAKKDAPPQEPASALTDQPVRVQEEPSVARAQPEETVPEATPPAATAPETVRPSFDVVRISPSGRAVIAGRAEPGAEVTVLDDGISLGSVFADERGEWVLLPEDSLEGGDRELSLVQDSADGERVASEQVVVLSVPRPRDKPAVVATASDQADITAAPVEAAEASAREATEQASKEPGHEASKEPSEEASEEPREEATQEAVIAVLVERDGDGPSRVLQGPDMAEDGIGEESEVTIRSVDYDSEGDVTLAGRTEPEATVNVYVDEEYVGSAKASEEGEWQLSPEEEVAPGQHKLRIDKVDDQGVVLARIETPISRARPEELLLGDALVVVQPGNSLWRIARRAYGGGIYYSEIYGANRAQILDPNMIFPGQILALPVLN